MFVPKRQNLSQAPQDRFSGPQTQNGYPGWAAGILSQRHPPPNFPYPNTINNLKLPERDGEIMHSMYETTDAAFERETTITLSDGDTLVRIWTSQHHVIQHLRKDKRFTETTDPSRCTTEEAEFTIPRTEWTPWGGAKHRRQLTDEQQIMEQAVADIWEYWPFRRTARYRAADQGAGSGRHLGILGCVRIRLRA